MSQNHQNIIQHLKKRTQKPWSCRPISIDVMVHNYPTFNIFGPQ